MNSITFVGLDVHKETIAVVVASNLTPRNGAEYRGEISNEPGAVRKLCDRLKCDSDELHFVMRLALADMNCIGNSWPSDMPVTSLLLLLSQFVQATE